MKPPQPKPSHSAPPSLNRRLALVVAWLSAAIAAGQHRPVLAVQETRPENQSKPAADIEGLPASGPVWTLEQLESLALSQNPSLAEAAARLDALAGKHLQAGLGPNPYIGYSGQQLFSNGEAEQQGFIVGQTFVRPRKLALDQAVVCREIDEASETLAVREQQVATDVRLAYCSVLVAQQRQSMTAELLGIAEKNLATVESLERAKEASRVDRLRADLEVQRATVQRKTADNGWRSAWRALAAVIGQPALEPGTVADLSAEPMDGVDEPTLLARIRQASPELRLASARRERAEAALRRAGVEPLPDLSVQAVVQSDNATSAANANLQITFPVPVRNRNQGGVRQAESELAAATEAIRRLELDLASRLAEVLERHRNAVALIEQGAAADGILAAAQQSLELVATAYTAGEVNYLELLTAQRVLAEARLQHLDAQSEYWATRCEIEGLLLSGSLTDSSGSR